MPAHRSEAEAEIRSAVVNRLRQMRPEARIIHEINASDFGNRIDVLAVDKAEIIAAEIKSEKDKLDRLPAQMLAMEGAAHYAIAAIHEKFLVEKKTNSYISEYERDGVHYRKTLPLNLKRHRTWIFPERVRSLGEGEWTFPVVTHNAPLPSKALEMLWRDELYHLCLALRIAVPKRARMPEMSRALRWHCTGKELTEGICAALRARDCVEADPPTFD